VQLLKSQARSNGTEEEDKVVRSFKHSVFKVEDMESRSGSTALQRILSDYISLTDDVLKLIEKC
jgi:hypothetical protein